VAAAARRSSPVRAPPISAVAKKGRPTQMILKSTLLIVSHEKGLCVCPEAFLGVTNCVFFRSDPFLDCFIRPSMPMSSRVPEVNAHA